MSRKFLIHSAWFENFHWECEICVLLKWDDYIKCAYKPYTFYTISFVSYFYLGSWWFWGIHHECKIVIDLKETLHTLYEFIRSCVATFRKFTSSKDMGVISHVGSLWCNVCVREFRALSTPKSCDDGDRIGSYRKRQVKIKERESVPRKSHCLAPRFALPGGVLKILYSIVPARLRFEGGGGATHARVDRRTSEFHTACISHLPAESFSAFARQKSQGGALLPEENFPPLCRVNVAKTRKSKQLVFERESAPIPFLRNVTDTSRIGEDPKRNY